MYQPPGDTAGDRPGWVRGIQPTGAAMKPGAGYVVTMAATRKTAPSSARRPAGPARGRASASIDLPLAAASAAVPAAYEIARRIAHEFPGVEDGTSYGTPALKVRGTFLARLREDGETLVLKTTFLERDLLLRADPATFFVTDHYVNYPFVLVRLSRIRRAQLRDCLEHSWRHVAPKRLVTTFDRSVPATTTR
jgi:hypothetical protein